MAVSDDRPDLQLEVTELRLRLAEAVAQQTAAAEVLQVINDSAGDIAPVFEAVLEKALRLCNAASGHILTYDGECFNLAALRGAPAFADWARQYPRIPPSFSVPFELLVSGEPLLHAADIAATPAYVDGEEAARRSSVGAQPLSL